MSYLIKIWLCYFTLLAVLMHQCGHDTSSSIQEENSNPVESVSVTIPSETNVFHESSTITRQVLITHCGSCHQSSLDTHKAAAIAIFDLDKNALWHEDLSAHHLSGIGNRLLNKSSLTEEQKEAIAHFIELKESHLEH